MQKRSDKISHTVYWTQLDDIDINLYDYILDKVASEYDQDNDPDNAVDRWIKGFWIMCQDVFTISTI